MKKSKNKRQELRKLKKQKNKALKLVRKWTMNFYAVFIEQIQQGYISPDDAILFVENEKSASIRINALRSELGSGELFEELRANPLRKRTREQAQNELDMWNARYIQISQRNVNGEHEAKQQLKNLKDIEKYIKAAENILDGLKLRKEAATPNTIKTEASEDDFTETNVEAQQSTS